MSIENSHKSKLKVFNSKEESLNDIDEQINILCEKLNNLDNSITSTIEKHNIHNQIEKLNLEKSQIENNQDQNSYFLDVAEILFNYTNNKHTSKMKYRDDSISNISAFVNRSQGKQNKQMYEQYNNIVTKNTDTSVECTKDYYCSTCNVAKHLIQNESILVCTSCGSFENFLDNTQNSITYEQEIHTESNINHGIYKRMSHFNDILSSCQGKTNVSIPNDLLDNIKNEMKKQKINEDTLNDKKMKIILKKIKASKFYDQTNKIISIITNKQLLYIPNSVEQSLKNMFRQIQEPFEKYKPSNRSNFLSYSYCFYQLLKLLGEIQYASLFPLLKSKDKLREQDRIWKNICIDLGWQFHPVPIL